MAGQPYQKIDNQFKDAISGMWYDKYDRLWVFTAVEDDQAKELNKKQTFDVFKDGVYLNKYTIEKSSKMEVVDFVNDKIAFIDMEENTVKICNY